MKDEKKLNQIILAGIFLSLSSLLILIQIPIFSFLKLDFSLVIILIAESYLSFSLSLFIGFFSPVVILIAYGDPIGMLFLMLLNIIVILFHHLFYSSKNKKNLFISSIIIILVTSVVVSFINIFIFVPLFYGFSYINDFLSMWLYWLLILSFNIGKLLLIYFIIGFYFYYLFEKNKNVI
ncbi:MAG: hypothetical protein HPAVJP_1680 [Candidatus Hepatoplasma vulgare]|nr:MAG: hypothetical protein HPAVJP_1680 [Candidatus Hepatoplasma sp.]